MKEQRHSDNAIGRGLEDSGIKHYNHFKLKFLFRNYTIKIQYIPLAEDQFTALRALTAREASIPQATKEAKLRQHGTDQKKKERKNKLGHDLIVRSGSRDC